jgi:hypothetical protein
LTSGSTLEVLPVNLSGDSLQLRTLTPPAVEPITLAEAKLALRVDHDEENADITRLIVAARELLELRASRTFVITSYSLALAGFPAGGGYFHRGRRADPSQWFCGGAPIQLPRPPLVSVQAVRYLDTAGASHTLSPSLYRVLPGSPGILAPAIGAAWPVTAAAPGALVIEYTAGYGAAAASVPERFRRAVHLCVGAWYENREDVITGTIVTSLPLGVAALIGADGRSYA